MVQMVLSEVHTLPTHPRGAYRVAGGLARVSCRRKVHIASGIRVRCDVGGRYFHTLHTPGTPGPGACRYWLLGQIYLGLESHAPSGSKGCRS